MRPFLLDLKEKCKNTISISDKKVLKRDDGADSEILKLAIDFCCLYQMDANHALFAFEIFFLGESFILSERLMIMKELNQKFN